ncbi:flagellar biosynthesis anti-sigma factor FlgM [Nevskia sp.]|uniref:flagellar biosynthesis anti-sigma factor FlgM n=1 Tax=Nevskia sp. TaxID=1929292 RepID=UPI0025D6C450|nr:flagellar biosynthesis anti-sigma factor FlgM [Nevskia sp.]
MTTKIDGFPSSGPRPIASGAAVKSAYGATGTSSGTPVAGVAADDRVQLTGDAVNLQQYEKALASVPDTNVAKVQQLRAKVAEGSYQPNPAAIAARLARFEFDLSAA